MQATALSRTALSRGIARPAAGVELAALTLFAIVLPLLLRHPQAVVGTAVNGALALAAWRSRSWLGTLPLVLLPAVAAVGGGALFGTPVSAGLVLLVPGIWAGNALFVALLRRMESRPLGLAMAATLKTAVIGLWIAGLVVGGLLPVAFLLVVAPMQLLTAAMGGLLALPVCHVLGRRGHQA
ncbi:MAG: hypothetical protein PWP23_2521 [Candidatus Sumerlaeota bacterium]|nr:hypothetical protein [Candidatus Sumerlaeota bacterium]